MQVCVQTTQHAEPQSLRAACMLCRRHGPCGGLPTVLHGMVDNISRASACMCEQNSRQNWGAMLLKDESMH